MTHIVALNALVMHQLCCMSEQLGGGNGKKPSQLESNDFEPVSLRIESIISSLRLVRSMGFRSHSRVRDVWKLRAAHAEQTTTIIWMALGPQHKCISLARDNTEHPKTRAR